MLRRDFLAATGKVGLGAVLMSGFAGRAIAEQELQSAIDVSLKKRLADAALNAARGAGATYTDVRVGRSCASSSSRARRTSRTSSTPSRPAWACA
ncbi:hypothetical protein AB5I41_12105 [Sphingomonas sp. MMS24-JH45]